MQQYVIMQEEEQLPYIKCAEKIDGKWQIGAKSYKNARKELLLLLRAKKKEIKEAIRATLRTGEVKFCRNHGIPVPERTRKPRPR